MKKEITVDKALKKYHQIDNAVSLLAAIAFFLPTILAISFYYSDNAVIIMLLAIFISLLLFAGFMTVLNPAFNIWKFWAFSRVSNAHELKKRLITLNEISEESTFFKRIENCTENDRKYWKLRLKFAREDIFVDDKTIPSEIVIHYSKTMGILAIVLLVPIFAFGILLLIFAIDENNSVGAIFSSFFSIVSLIGGYFYGYKKLKNREPQLILSNKGIENSKTGFHKWEEIEEYNIITGRQAYLRYTHSKGKECIGISYLNIKNNGIKLSKLLMVYRERNKLQNLRKTK